MGEQKPGKSGDDSNASVHAPAIFISYASQDAGAAKRICDALRAAGIEVWFDQSELRGGDAWDAAIRKQVKECALFIPLISANTEGRSEGYFRREWNLAVNRMLDMAEDSAFLVPIAIDDTPELGARVPERFRERQWTRLPGGVAPAEFAERIRTLLVGARAKDSTNRGTSAPVTIDPRVPADEGFWVAVLPFKCGGSNSDLIALTDALSEEITTGLSRFSYLRVISRSLTSRFVTATTDLRTIGRELRARYVMEGGLRLAGTRLRVAVQLTDTATGAHLWAESYERTFSPEALFDLQDDLVPRIVSTVADMHGVLPHSMSEAVRGKEPGALTPYEAVLRGFSYEEQLRAEEHAIARASLERALQQVPGYADGWIMLSLIYCNEHALGLNPLPESLARAENAARRAVDAAPGNYRAYYSLAYALFHRKEFAEFRNAAERALALNPLDGANVWTMGMCMAYAGDWERGCKLVERAMQLNPNHPGKYWYPIAYNAYRKRDYPSAVSCALKINTPGLFFTPLLIAIAQAQLGDMNAASKALRELLRLRPDYGAIAREDLGKWFDAQLVEHCIEGLRKAGLDVQPANAEDPLA